MKLYTIEGVYQPREDSYLLQKEVKKLCNKLKPERVLDVGTGSGIQAITAARSGEEEVIAVDLNPAALKVTAQNAKKNGVEIKTRLSDLLSAFDESDKFDLIIFNPPYLKSEYPVDLQWSGGAPLIKRFLEQAREHLTEDGKILFVYSSLTNLKEKVKIIAQQTMPDGEELYVAEA